MLQGTGTLGMNGTKYGSIMSFIFCLCRNGYLLLPSLEEKKLKQSFRRQLIMAPPTLTTMVRSTVTTSIFADHHQ